MAGSIRIVLTFVLSCCFISAGIAAQESIGEQGATARLSKNWTRQSLDPDLGKDQFVVTSRTGMFKKSKQACLVVFETENVLENEQDFRRLLDSMMQVGAKAALELREENGYLRGTRRTDAKMSGLRLSYRLEVLSQDGLSYLVMSWASQSQKDFLEQKVDEFLRGFRFPGTSSSWHGQRQPVMREYPLPGFTLAFSVRPFVLRERPLENEQVAHLADADYDHAVFAFEISGESIASVLESAAEICGEGSTSYAEVSREEITVSGRTGQLLVTRDTTTTYHLIALPLANGRVLDLRYAAPGAPDTRRTDRELFFRTLRLEPARSVLSLPEPAAMPPQPNLGPHQKKVFERAEMLGKTGLPYTRFAAPLGDDQWLVLAGDKAVRVTAGQEPETLVGLDQNGMACMVRQGRSWLVVSTAEQVHPVRGGVVGEALFTARCLAVAGEDLLLVRSAPAGQLAGLANAASPMGSDLLIRRTPDGTETEIARLPDANVSQIVVHPERPVALLMATHRPTASALAYRAGARCIEIDLDRGAVRDVADWQDVDAIAASDTGWLVTGRPRGGAQGIYDVPTDGAPQPLFTGERSFGLELRDGRLVFASDLSSTESKQPYLVYGIGRDDIVAVGPRCTPLSVGHLNALGAEFCNPTAGGAPPRTVADVHAVLKAAGARAHERHGFGLPRSPVAIDALVQEVVNTRNELEPAGRVLLGMLIVASNVDQGAQWVEGESDWTAWIWGPDSVSATSFAVPYTPGELLTVSLDDSEGFWDPAAGLRKRAEGRVVLLGTDRAALRQRVAQATPPGIDASLAEGNHQNITAVIDGMPHNVFFRARVYEALATHGHYREIEQLARPRAQQENAQVTDLRAWLAAWNQRVPAGAEAEELANAALAAVRQHPADANLCLTLALAYEKARPQDPEYARTCYQRVVSMQSWGPVGQTAQAALQRLNAAAPGK